MSELRAALRALPDADLDAAIRHYRDLAAFLEAERDQRRRRRLVERETAARIDARPPSPAEQKQAARMARDRLILQRAAKGWTDREIARSVGLSPRQVSRIVAKGARATSSASPSRPGRPW